MATLSYGNTAATSPKDAYLASLDSRANIPAGQAASPWVLPANNPTSSPTTTPISPTTNPTAAPTATTPTASVNSARTSYLNSFSNTPELNSARQTYLDSFNPSSAVTDARKKYLDFTSDADSGIAALEGQGRGIPLSLVRGEQAKLGQQAETTAKRLQGDVDLAEQDQTLAQNRAKAGLDFATGDSTNAQNSAQASLGFANDDQTASDKNTATAADFNQKNNITQPFYYVGNKIVNASTGKAEYQNNNGEIVRLSDGKRYSNPQQFYQDSGVNSFDQIQKQIGTNANTASKFETVTLGSGKNAQKVRYGYDTKGNIVSATDLATGQSILGQNGKTGVIKPGGTTPTTTKVTVTEGTNLVDQYLSPLRGNDGFVSPQDWAKAKAAWIEDKLDVNQFYSRFKKYMNPADAQDYK